MGGPRAGARAAPVARQRRPVGPSGGRPGVHPGHDGYRRGSGSRPPTTGSSSTVPARPTTSSSPPRSPADRPGPSAGCPAHTPPVASSCDRPAPAPALRALRRRATSTWARAGPRCSTGCWPSRRGGTFILRIEDTDAARNRPEWTQGILDALAWLGISSDDPQFEGPYFQSRARRRSTAPRRPRSSSRGAAYYCDCTREDIEARNEGGTGRAGLRRLLPRPRASGPGRGRALRFRVPRAGAHRRSSTSSGARPRSTTSRSRTSSSCGATARRCSSSPTSSTT